MAYKFDATTFDATIGPAFINVVIGFNLVDDAVIDPGTGKPTILASKTVSINVQKTADTTTAKQIIASECALSLQTFYNEWSAKKAKVVDWLTSNEAALETYLASHITF